MTTSIGLIIALLPALILCGSFKWDLNLAIDDVLPETTILSKTSADGCTHLFWVGNCSYGQYINYQTILPNGTQINRMKFGYYHLYFGFLDKVPNLAAEVSNDGTHIMFASTAYRYSQKGLCFFLDDSSCHEVLFFESIDGGKNWSYSIKMNRTSMYDGVHRELPSIALDKTTGRVYVAYYHGSDLAISIKEPGKTSFEPEIVYRGKELPYFMYFGFTVDKASLQKIFHLFWGYRSRSFLNYSYSIDDLKTWSEDVTLLTNISGYGPPPVVMDSQIVEGGIFTQYFQKNDIKILWSKNHGKKWEQPFRVGTDFNSYNNIAMCGTNGKGLIFSSNVKFLLGNGFIRYLRPYETHFTSLPYPFPSVANSGAIQSDISCGYVGDNQYSVTFIVLDNSKKIIHLARGTLKDISTSY